MPTLRIIEPDLAAKVDAIMDDRHTRYMASLKDDGRALHKSHGRYLLSGGMLICPTCGGHFEGRKNPWKPSPKTAKIAKSSVGHPREVVSLRDPTAQTGSLHQYAGVADCRHGRCPAVDARRGSPGHSLYQGAAGTRGFGARRNGMADRGAGSVATGTRSTGAVRGVGRACGVRGAGDHRAEELDGQYGSRF